MSIERLKASRIPTLDASNLTYQVENVRVHAVSYTHLDVYKRQLKCSS